jgi:hypothetical protein
MSGMPSPDGDGDDVDNELIDLSNRLPMLTLA